MMVFMTQNLHVLTDEAWFHLRGISVPRTLGDVAVRRQVCGVPLLLRE